MRWVKITLSNNICMLQSRGRLPLPFWDITVVFVQVQYNYLILSSLWINMVPFDFVLFVRMLITCFACSKLLLSISKKIWKHASSHLINSLFVLLVFVELLTIINLTVLFTRLMHHIILVMHNILQNNLIIRVNSFNIDILIVLRTKIS